MLYRSDKGENLDIYYSETAYQNQKSVLKYTFTGIEFGQKYKVYPIVKLSNIEMLATPSSDIELKGIPVQITDFKQTESEYDKDAFTYDGRIYSYKYYCAVTVQLTNTQNVEDWGYVYRDLYGKTTHISLKGLGSPYTDTRYAYYRNESNSVVTLYPYIKYVGENDYTYGKVKNYPITYQGGTPSETLCSDNNHPHWIDLGLPSGIKWSCCNYGAGRPEEYGTVFSLDNTQSWPCPIPTLDTYAELSVCCSSEFVYVKGIGGYKYVAPNGNAIFMPNGVFIPQDGQTANGYLFWHYGGIAWLSWDNVVMPPGFDGVGVMIRPVSK